MRIYVHQEPVPYRLGHVERAPGLIGRCLKIRRMMAVLLGLALTAWGADRACGQQHLPSGKVASSPKMGVTREDVEQLVQQLGASEFREREQAESRLDRMGLLAFEALVDQRDHENIEIRLASRRLVEQLRKRFLSEDVDEAFREILQSYTTSTAARRELIVRYFADLLPQQAGNELARIARIEKDPHIAMLAALAFMEVPFAEDQAARRAYASTIESSIGYGDRLAVRALRLYVQALRQEPFERESPAVVWQTWIAAEEDRVEASQFDSGSPSLVRPMQRVLGDLFLLAGDRKRAEATWDEYNTLGFGDAEECADWQSWLLQRSAWESAVKLAKECPDHFVSNSVLEYGLAESQMRLKRDKEIVEATLQRALAVAPDPNDIQHMRAAAFLVRRRGLFEWAEREFRFVIDHEQTDAERRLGAYAALADMLDDIGKPEQAYETLDTMLNTCDADPEFLGAVVQVVMDIEIYRSQKHLYRARHFQSVHDVEHQKEQLELAKQGNPLDPDVLIAMFRIENADEPWRIMTSRSIKNATEVFGRNIYDIRNKIEAEDADQSELKRDLATALNQLAWLVSNTEGDYDEALRMGRQALQLQPGDAGIMDTLARCYYSVGDYRNAVKYQRWAHQRLPHSRTLLRQLALFESALAKPPAQP